MMVGMTRRSKDRGGTTSPFYYNNMNLFYHLEDFVTEIKACKACKGTGEIDKINHVDVGRYIRRLRKHAGLTQGQVSELTGYSVGYLCDLEYGRKDWRDELYTAIYDALIDHIESKKEENNNE